MSVSKHRVARPALLVAGVLFLASGLTACGGSKRARRLKKAEIQDQRYKECTSAAPAEIWVVSDFFRKKGVFPHGRKAGSFEGGVNVNFLDGHAGRVWKKPRDTYR